MPKLSDPISFRRAATSWSLVGAAVLVLAGVLTSPPQGDGAAEYLTSLAAHPGATQLSAVLLHFGFLLLVPASVGLLALLRHRAVALGHVAVGIALLGSATLAGNVLTDFFDLALAQNLPTAQAVEVTKAAEAYSAAALFIVPGFFGTVLGFTLLAVALWRAGVVPSWFPVSMFAAWAAFFVQTPVGAAALLLVLGYLARRVAADPRGWGEPETSPAADDGMPLLA